MKKRKFLIAFILAILTTSLSLFRVARFENCIPTGWWICLHAIPPYPIIQRGFPIYYWTNWPKQTGSFVGTFFVVDIFFWFIFWLSVLTTGQWVIKKLRFQKRQ